MSVHSMLARLNFTAMLALVGAHTSYAQRIEPVGAYAGSLPTDDPSRHSAQPAAPQRPLLTWGGVGGAILGAPAGAFVGMLAGAAFAHIGTCNGSECSLGAGLAGAAIGETIGVAVGAHLGSSRRGNLAASVLTSAGIAGAGALLLRYPSSASPSVAIAIPVLQLVSVLAFER